jgi:hypothetical protein
VTDFENARKDTRQQGVIGEFWHFLRSSRKWWLLPIIAVLLILAALAFLSTTAAAPFIYTLF